MGPKGDLVQIDGQSTMHLVLQCGIAAMLLAAFLVLASTGSASAQQASPKQDRTLLDIIGT